MPNGGILINLCDFEFVGEIKLILGSKIDSSSGFCLKLHQFEL